MTICSIQESGLVELYFYDELSPRDRDDVARHLPGCADCRAALDELETIRAALAGRTPVSAPAGGDWSSLMSRIERAVEVEPARPSSTPGVSIAAPSRRPIATLVAAAATVALLTGTLVYQALERRTMPGSTAASTTASAAPAMSGSAPAPTEVMAPSPDAGFAAVSEEHFERSKLVILGLTARDPRAVSSADWAYERQLAGSLLDDTRLYKQTAEARGLGALAGVMSDLELVLLQTSLTEEPDAATLNRLQRLIRQRDLVAKMEVSKWF